MALASLLLPSSSASTASKAAGDRADSRRHDHHHHGSKRKKKPPPPSPQPSLSSAPRTPPGARSQRGMAVSASSSKKSPKVAAAAAAKNRPQYQQHRVQSTKKATATAASSSSSSWEQVKSLLSCRSATAAARVHDPAAPSALARLRGSGAGACGASLCAMRDVVDAASSAAASASADRDTAPLNRRRAHRAGSSSSSSAAAGGGSHSSLRGLSGCYECRAINVEPMSRRYPRPRELCACPQCGEVFTKADSLEHHQAIRHAVSELGPEDSGRNIVEIIFKSSWQKRDRPICHIDRILKVHNAPRTVARFEAYRDAVRSRCRATAARAAADGNELLRFHSAPLACALGLSGATSLCAGAAADPSSIRSSNAAAVDTASSSSSPAAAPPATAAAAACCGVCTAIRHGFAPWVGAHQLGVRTTASSGRAHDCGGSESVQAAANSNNGGCRAMLVCRVIAGRVRRDGDATSAAGEEGPFDSVAGEDAASSSVYGNLEELFVANPRAILPCFVVIYRVLE
ncbi:hypothetical protein SETIT_7G012600v2 [Setaria italica]|uniref:C2H2-type domain-containing protein n=1 Tax=Setaria italica TaxID=4555 RepID=K3Y6M2_SETIT|nr:uncharacterized protein LOC101752639 [Setaria italica]RCV32558.1 hypothetical protein SETIT_7G012600v2 [Setaria italica]